MSYALWLVPVGLGMGLVGLVAFLWSMKSGQFDDLDGAAERVLMAEAADHPLPAETKTRPPQILTGTEGAEASLQHTRKEGAHRDAHC